MDQQSQNQQATPVNDGISDEQIAQLKQKTIISAKEYAMRGTKTHKPAEATGQSAYDWWEKQGSYEGNTWSVSYWQYDNKSWQLQATKVEVRNDGHSQMTSYSLREENDPNFPGFQIYQEQTDDRYRKTEPEDVVYINRVIEGLLQEIAG